MTLPYVPPVGILRAAVECVYHGMQVTCTREDWPAVRVALSEQADEWDYLGGKSNSWIAGLARSEIRRLDAWFADPSNSEATSHLAINPGGL